MNGVTGIFEGGGIKGVALAGGAAAALDLGVDFAQTVGTSAGALVAALVAAGSGADELERAVQEVDWPSMIDRSPLGRVPVVGPHLAMMFSGGVARGRRLECKVEELLGRKGIRTFGDLAPSSLRVVATDLSHGTGVVLPEGLRDYDLEPSSFSVARAVMASAAVPFVFQPVTIRNPATGETSLLADGALAARFPVQVVAPGVPTLGFRLGSDPEDHDHREIGGPLSLAAAVMAAAMTARESLPVLCREVGKTVEIRSDRPSLDFEVTPAEALEMFTEARVSATEDLRRMLSPIVDAPAQSWP